MNTADNHSPARRTCKDCDTDLRPRQGERCDRCGAVHRQRERRRRLLEDRTFGPECEIDDVVLRAVDIEELCELSDEVATRAASRDMEKVTYRGVVETDRIIAECLLETEHRQHHRLAPWMHKPSRRVA